MRGLRRAIRTLLDLALGRLAQAVVLAFHRRVDVLHRDRLRIDGPTLLVANHGNGFVDPAVVASSLRRVPRFVAKSTLWNFPIARPFLALAGVIPVYRSSDGDTTSNVSTFQAVHDVLAAGGTVAIFPEGTSSDRPGLETVRTGAARMALGALAMTDEVTILPIGLSFESHVHLRPSAAVFVGEPIRVDAWRREAGHAGAGEDDQEAVRDLTECIRERLAAVSPAFASLDERLLLRAAAAVNAREEDRRVAPRFGRVEEIARTIADRPENVRERVLDAYRDYATRLSLIGLSDDDLETRAELRQLARPVLAGLAIALAGPLLVTLTLIHLPALALVRVSTSVVRSPVKKGTTRLLLGLFAGLVTWIVTGVVLADGLASFFVAVAVAVLGAVAFWTWLPLVTLGRRLIGRVKLFDRRQLAEQSRHDRDEVIAAVQDALAA